MVVTSSSSRPPSGPKPELTLEAARPASPKEPTRCPSGGDRHPDHPQLEQDDDGSDLGGDDSEGDQTEDLSLALLAKMPSSLGHEPQTCSTSSTRSPSQSSLSRVRTPTGLRSGACSPSGSDANTLALLPLPLACSTVPGSPACTSARALNLPPVTPSRELRSSAGFAARGGAIGGRVTLTLTVTSRCADEEMTIDLGCSQAQIVTALPSPLPFEVPATAEIRGIGPITGSLQIRGVPPIPFGIQTGSVKPNGDRHNFVSSEQRQRSVITHAENLEQGNGTSVDGEGVVVDLSVSDGFFAEMKVIIRRAKKKELTRLAQKQQLLNAMEKKKYSSLMAQITKARTRKVELGLIDQAERILKSLAMADGTFLNHRELSKLMRWKRVTDTSTVDATIEDCTFSEDCPCNAGQAQDGEVLSITEGVVQQVMEGIAPAGADGDKWLFKALVRAAYSVPEGCVWKSGGKFILSNEERNQSVTAIANLLERENAESDAGKGIRALVAYTEKEYGFRVTAIQLNFHPNEKTSHKNHRDIYGAGQKGGINCTCSFMKCQGTVCYSLGSSRQILCETITDSRSKYDACSEECGGRKVLHWLSSGSAMFFNDKWNTSHTHGIPQMSEPCGPRISVALLCA